MSAKAYLADGPLANTLLEVGDPLGARDGLVLPYAAPGGTRYAQYRRAAGGLPGELRYEHVGEVVPGAGASGAGGGEGHGGSGGGAGQPRGG